MDKPSESTSKQLEADLHFLESQHPELSMIARNLAQIALSTTPAPPDTSKIPNEIQKSLSSVESINNNAWQLYLMQLQLQDPNIQNLIVQQQKQSQAQNTSNTNTSIKNSVENVHLDQHSVSKPKIRTIETLLNAGVPRSGSFDGKTVEHTGANLHTCDNNNPSGPQTPCSSNVSVPKYSDSSLLTSHQKQLMTEQELSDQQINQLLQYLICNNLPQNSNLNNLNLLTQLLQSPITSSEPSNVWSSIIQPLTKQILQNYQQHNMNNENPPTGSINSNNNSNTDNNNNNNNSNKSSIAEHCLPETKTPSMWTDGFNTQHSVTETCPSPPPSNVQLTNQSQNISTIRNQEVNNTDHKESVNKISSQLDEHKLTKLNPYEQLQSQEMNQNNNTGWSNSTSYTYVNDNINTVGHSGQLSNFPRLINQERPWMKSYHRDRFVVRITSVTYRCSCRSNTPPNRHRNNETRRDQVHGKECKRSDPRTFVTFQSQLPSLISPDNAKKNGRHLHHIPLTGLRLGFSCPLISQGPPMSDFNTPKVLERLDAWEQAGNRPGFRIQVLTALQQTVRQMLELIRTKGFGAVKLDTDYVFFPSAPDLQPVYTRRRPLSSSSDGSLPRVMGLERIRREVSNEPKNHSFNTKLNENLDNHQKSEHSVWTDIMNNPEVESNTIATTNTPNSSSITMPRNRPRTWHHLPGHNSLVMSSLLPKDKSDYGIHNENGDETENDNFTNDNNHHFNSLSSRTSGIPVNQSMLNTCWCATKSMRLPIHHSLGYSSSLSSSPVGINPNPHIVVNQMKLSPYTTVDERYLLGGNANVTNQLHKQMDAPYSTPVSPTPFILGEPMNRNKIHNCKMNVHQTLVSSQTATKLEISRTPEICASERFYTINNTEQKPEINGRSDHLSKILREISNCLHTNPQYPVVIMPTYNMLSSSGNEQTNDTNNKATPLVFQIPHSDSVFVGLPATSGVNPRVMTASPTNAVVILPSVSTNEIMQQSTSQQHQDYLPSSGTQPTILTGPKQGYLLIITPDNKYEYVPRS